MTRLALVVVSCSLIAAPALAQEAPAEPEAEGAAASGTGLPLPWAQRPLTLTQYTLRIDGAFSIETFEDLVDPFDFEVTTPSPAIVGAVGVGFGLHDDFEVGAVVLPVLFSPRLRYIDPSVYATFRFLRGRGELGANLRVTFPVRNDAEIDPGLVLLLHLGESARFDAAVRFPITVTREDAFVDLVVPLEISLNLTESLYAGAATGFELPRFDPERFIVPVHVFAGYAIPGSDAGPLVDIEARFGWPELFAPGDDANQVHGARMRFILLGRVYLDVLR